MGTGVLLADSKAAVAEIATYLLDVLTTPGVLDVADLLEVCDHR